MITEGLKGRVFITLRDFTKAEIGTMLEVALRLKADRATRRGIPISYPAEHCL